MSPSAGLMSHSMIPFSCTPHPSQGNQQLWAYHLPCCHQKCSLLPWPSHSHIRLPCGCTARSGHAFHHRIALSTPGTLAQLVSTLEAPAGVVTCPGSDSLQHTAQHKNQEMATQSPPRTCLTKVPRQEGMVLLVCRVLAWKKHLLWPGIPKGQLMVTYGLNGCVPQARGTKQPTGRISPNKSERSQHHSETGAASKHGGHQCEGGPPCHAPTAPTLGVPRNVASSFCIPGTVQRLCPPTHTPPGHYAISPTALDKRGILHG